MDKNQKTDLSLNRRQHGRVSPSAADPAESVERVISRRQLILQAGDVILSRESASRVALTHASAWRYRLHVHPDPVRTNATMYAKYDSGAIAGDEMAAGRRVRLFYEEDGLLTLLKDYRPS